MADILCYSRNRHLNVEKLSADRLRAVCHLMDNFTEWAGRFPMNMPECHDCPYIALCGGGCIYNSYVSNDTIWGKDPQVCRYMKGMVDWILLDLWRDSGMASKYGTIETREVRAHESCID